MNRFTQCLLMAAAVVSPTIVHAQSEDKPLTVGVSGGVSVPTGDLADAVDAGYSVAGHVFFAPAALTSVRFRGDVSFDQFSYKKGSSLSDESFRSLGFVANAMVDLTSGSSSMMPYLVGGLGVYSGKASGSDDSSTDFGLQVGAGLTFKLSGFATFLEAKYVNVFSDPNSTGYLPITFGVRF
ncbi:MAG: outer membrane beta-barrel protein [Gemmatimonadota bacterium]|nr:outer membrane beta-barrel protein [Gemmatimonadota bacterium]